LHLADPVAVNSEYDAAKLLLFFGGYLTLICVVAAAFSRSRRDVRTPSQKHAYSGTFVNVIYLRADIAYL
jgi:hypothetical protein